MTKVTFAAGWASISPPSQALTFALSTNNNHTQNPNAMNKFTSTLFAAAFVIFSCAPALANTTSTEANTDHSIVLNDVVKTTYNVNVLAVHPDGNRAFFNGNYPSLNQAYLAYQGFSFELPESSTVIYANITDSNGMVIFSIQN